MSLLAQMMGVIAGQKAPVPANTLVQMHMDGSNGSTTFTDVIGHTFATTSGVTISTAQSKIGGASLFTNNNNDIHCTHADFGTIGTGDLTVEMWIYRTLDSTYQYFVGTNTGFYIGVGSGNTYVLNVGGSTKSSGDPASALNTWQHVALVRQSGTMTFYLNGTSTSSFADSTNMTQTALSIGSYTSNGPNPWGGYIDEVRISNVAHYTSNFTPSTSAFADS